MSDTTAHEAGGESRTKALAVHEPTCLIHRFDTSRLTCLVCGLRIYVEVRIS